MRRYNAVTFKALVVILWVLTSILMFLIVFAPFYSIDATAFFGGMIWAYFTIAVWRQVTK